MADRKHLFGTSEKSDFIVNMTDEGAKKFCAMYCIIAMIIIELAAIPYYLTKNVVDYTENVNGLDVPHYLSDKIIYWAAVVMFGLGLLGLSVFLIGKMKKQISLANNKALLWLGGVIVMSLISALAAESIVNSMTGYLDRAEGFLTLIGYYGFFAAAFTVIGEGWKKRLCQVIVCIGAVNAVVGILQIIPALSETIPNWFNKLNINFFNAHAIPAANGLAMTPHALAALLTVAFAVSFAMAVYAENGKMKLLYGAACVLMAAAAQMTRLLTAWIGIGCAVVLGIVLAIVYQLRHKAADEESDTHENIKQTVITAVCVAAFSCAALGGMLALQLNSYTEDDGYKTFYDEEIIRTDSIRMLMLLQKADESADEWIYPYLWDDGMFVAEQVPLLGTGPDNWETAYKYGLGIDRCYNEYVDTAVQRGFLTLGLYVIFLLITIVKAVQAFALFVKGEAGPAAPAVLTAVLAYSVQAFFNISTLESTPFFFICAGLAWSYFAVKRTKEK